MLYLKVTWLNNDPEDPVQFYHEIDDGRYEKRKITIHKDGRITVLFDAIENNDDYLSPAPIPPIEEINEDGEFIAQYIEKDEFDKIWTEAMQE